MLFPANETTRIAGFVLVACSSHNPLWGYEKLNLNGEAEDISKQPKPSRFQQTGPQSRKKKRSTFLVLKTVLSSKRRNKIKKKKT